MERDLLEVEAVEASRGRAVLQLRGELDLSTAAKLEEPLMRRIGQGQPVVVDLTGVDFIDSSGIAVLLRPIRNSNGEGPRVHVATTTGSQVERVFQVAGVMRALPVFSDPEEALNALPPNGSGPAG